MLSNRNNILTEITYINSNRNDILTEITYVIPAVTEIIFSQK